MGNENRVKKGKNLLHIQRIYPQESFHRDYYPNHQIAPCTPVIKIAVQDLSNFFLINLYPITA